MTSGFVRRGQGIQKSRWSHPAIPNRRECSTNEDGSQQTLHAISFRRAIHRRREENCAGQQALGMKFLLISSRVVYNIKSRMLDVLWIGDFVGASSRERLIVY